MPLLVVKYAFCIGLNVCGYVARNNLLFQSSTFALMSGIVKTKVLWHYQAVSFVDRFKEDSLSGAS